VDLTAVNSKLEAELSRIRGDATHTSARIYKELANETAETLKKRIVELDNEIGRYWGRINVKHWILERLVNIGGTD